MEKFIVADGCALRVSDTRRGERTILLLHGFLESLDVWDDFTRLLAPHARVVALDLPGHGVSEVKGAVHSMEFLADVVYNAMRQMNAVKYTVVGHSMGGYVALALAARHPEVLDAVVLFSSTPNADSEAKKIDREREIAIIESGRKELLSRTLPGKGFAPQNRARFADRIEDFAELIMFTDEEGTVALIRGMMERADRGTMLRELPLPQLFIFGRHDEYISPETAAAVIAANPQARVTWLDESGHNGFIEEPETAANAIIEIMGLNNQTHK